MAKLVKNQTVRLIKDAKTGIGSIIQAGTEVRINKVGKNGYFCSVGRLGMYFDRSDLENSIEIKERKKRKKVEE